MRPDTYKGVHYRPPQVTNIVEDVIYITSFTVHNRAFRLAWSDNLNCRLSPGSLDRVARRKRQPSPRARQAQSHRRQQGTAAESPGLAKEISQMSAAEALERIERARAAQHQAEAELALLIDHAITLGLAWPEIAVRLGVTRQAARQHYQRRHRAEADPKGRPA
jgi:hypothetical protein